MFQRSVFVRFTFIYHSFKLAQEKMCETLNQNKGDSSVSKLTVEVVAVITQLEMNSK